MFASTASASLQAVNEKTNPANITARAMLIIFLIISSLIVPLLEH